MEEKIKGKGKRTWCCWVLSEEEILHVAEDVLGSVNPQELISEDEMAQIVDEFKEVLSNEFFDCEEVLTEIVKNNTLDKDKRMIETLKRELKEIHIDE